MCKSGCSPVLLCQELGLVGAWGAGALVPRSPPAGTPGATAPGSWVVLGRADPTAVRCLLGGGAPPLLPCNPCPFGEPSQRPSPPPAVNGAQAVDTAQALCLTPVLLLWSWLPRVPVLPEQSLSIRPSVCPASQPAAPRGEQPAPSLAHPRSCPWPRTGSLPPAWCFAPRCSSHLSPC